MKVKIRKYVSVLLIFLLTGMAVLGTGAPAAWASTFGQLLTTDYGTTPTHGGAYYWRGYSFQVSQTTVVTHLVGGGTVASTDQFSGAIFSSTAAGSSATSGQPLAMLRQAYFTGSTVNQVVAITHLTLQPNTWYFIAQGSHSSSTYLHWFVEQLNANDLVAASFRITKWLPSSTDGCHYWTAGNPNSVVVGQTPNTSPNRPALGFRFESTASLPGVVTQTTPLHGQLTSTGGSPTAVYMEYSTNPTLSTGVQVNLIQAGYTGSVPYDFSVSTADLNLPPNVTYYYRARALNDAGRVDGVIRSFTTKQSQTVTFATGAWQSKTVGGASFSLSATASSGLPVSYTSSNTNVATISGNTVNIVGHGTTNITASQPGDATYDPAANVTRTLTVTPAAPSLTVSNRTPDYTVNDLEIVDSVNPSASTEYRIERSTDNSSWTAHTTWGAAKTGLSHIGLSANTTYYYRVQARNTAATSVLSALSSVVSVKTNASPVLSNLQPTSSRYHSAVGGYEIFTLSGTVADADSNTVTVSATVNGVSQSTSVSATPGGTSWSLAWDVSGFPESSFTAIAVSADDNTGKSNATASATWSHTLYVDKTPPAAPVITTETNWTNAALVPVTITHGADPGAGSTGAGVHKSQYKLEGATTQSWTDYSGLFNISAAGETTVSARTIDLVGNVGPESTAVVKIDRTAPSSGLFTITATYDANETTYTRNREVNIVDITATDTGGAGDGTDPDIPNEMEISNFADFSTSSGWVAYFPTYNNWTLTEGDGVKTVYVRFRDLVGNVSTASQNNITFDSTPPVLTISAPDRYVVKKGDSVSYTVHLDDNNSHWVDFRDKIELSAMGTVESQVADIQANHISVTEISTTIRRVTITLPAGMSEEGTISIKILAAATEDPAGNLSAEAVGNFSFNVDSTPPYHQDALFTEDLTIAGGQPVALAIASYQGPGGEEGDSVRFAPVAYNGTDAANGTTITSTHGTSSFINAPTTAGTYKLYILDAAGNVSGPSVATLTVKNDGPAVSVAGPSAAYVQADSTVEYIVTYSSDADDITLGQFDVALIRTGTANAYVSVGEISGEPLKRQVSLTNLMGEGTVKIKIAAGSATDEIGNPAAASAESEPVNVDNTPAVLGPVTIASNNVQNTAAARGGDTISINFTSNEPLGHAEATVNGRGMAVSHTNSEKTEWTAVYPIPVSSTMDDGAVSFQVTTTDRAGNVASPVTATTDSSSVALYLTSPVITLTGVQDTRGYYVDPVTIEFNTGTASLEELDDQGDVIATTEPASGASISETGSYRLTVTDAVGNQSTQLFTLFPLREQAVMADYDVLKITYAPGDSADSVTRNLVSLPSEGEFTSDVTWAVTSGSAVTLPDPFDGTGSVDRPSAGAGDDSVVLTATISKDGFSREKTFSLTVKALIGDDDAAKATEDARLARITYAEGDSQGHVTQAVELASSGIMHASDITWESANPAVIAINENAEGGYFATAVHRPTFAEGDIEVELKATATRDDLTSEQTFTLTVKKQAGTEAQQLAVDADTVTISYAAGDDQDNVRGNVSLVFDPVHGSTIAWSSSHPQSIAISGASGVVTRPSSELSDQAVTITATVQNGSQQEVRQFTLTVLAEVGTPDQDLLDVTEVAENLAIGYRGTDNAQQVTTHLILDTVGSKGTTITWRSNKSEILADGTVNPSPDGDEVVTLTAEVTKGDALATKSFTLTVKQRIQTLLQQLGADARNTAIQYAAGDSAGSVRHNLQLMQAGLYGSTISWQSSVPEVINQGGVVTRGAVNRPVTMTATISKEGYLIYRTFELTVRGIE